MNYNSNGSWRGLCYGIKGKVACYGIAAKSESLSCNKTIRKRVKSTCYGMSENKRASAEKTGKFTMTKVAGSP
jgi:hypothetical protein